MRSLWSAVVLLAASLGCGPTPPDPDMVARQLRSLAPQCTHVIESDIQSAPWLAAFWERNHDAIAAQFLAITQSTDDIKVLFRNGGDSFSFADSLYQAGSSLEIRSGTHLLNSSHNLDMFSNPPPISIKITFDSESFETHLNTYSCCIDRTRTVVSGYACETPEVQVDFNTIFLAPPESGENYVGTQWLVANDSHHSYASIARIYREAGASDNAPNRGHMGEMCRDGECTGIARMEQSKFMPDRFAADAPKVVLPSWLNDAINKLPKY